MRLTILAGLITGTSLAIQVALSAHTRPKVPPPNSAIRMRTVAPWYIASNAPLSYRCIGEGTIRKGEGKNQIGLAALGEVSPAGPMKSNESQPRSGSTRLTCTIIGI